MAQDRGERPVCRWPGTGRAPSGALRRDAALLDALSARRSLPPHAADDPAVGLLTALAVDVDSGLGRPGVPLHTVTGGSFRGRGRPTAIALGLAAAVLSAGGAACAVTGEPLTALRRVTSGDGTGTTPAASAETAGAVRSDLEAADHAIRQGDAGAARERLRLAREKAARLESAGEHAAQRRADQLQARLAKRPVAREVPRHSSGDPVTSKAGKMADRKVTRPPHRAADKASRKSAQSTRKLAQKSTRKATQKPAWKATQKVARKATQKAARKAVRMIGRTLTS
jgi:hypothetical protein